ncbi:MAG: dTMP kinase [Geminicoccaceae bacterium]|nr:dTMP kinase [Geminicoccaceae bacterium]
MTDHAGRGRFITLEGGEGAGKTTQLRRLVDYLGRAGQNVRATREPGGTQGAEEIRTLVTGGKVDRWHPMTELLLMMAARSDHIERVIRPSLARGEWVVSDRFHDSSRVYQGLAGGLGLETVDRLHEPLLDGVLPDLTIILDLPVETGLARRGNEGGGGRFEAKDRGFHEAVRQGFRELAAREPRRFAIIDASVGVDEVSRQIEAALETIR